MRRRGAAKERKEGAGESDSSGGRTEKSMLSSPFSFNRARNGKVTLEPFNGDWRVMRSKSMSVCATHLQLKRQLLVLELEHFS